MAKGQLRGNKEPKKPKQPPKPAPIPMSGSSMTAPRGGAQSKSKQK